jgi:AcrR family transcriptional regulator
VIDGRARTTELLAAAFAEVAEVGFEGLRLRQVAANVGIDQSTLHHYFATKAALVEAVAEYTTTRLASTAPPRGLPRAEALAAHLRKLAELMHTEPDLLTVSAELDLRARRDPAVRRLLEAQEAGWRQALIPLFTTNAAASAELVIATVKGVRLSPGLATTVLDGLLTLLDNDREK